MEVKLPEKVARRFTTALNILKLDEHERQNVRAFTVVGLDLFHAGTTKSKFGGLVGIPHNFTYDNPDHIERAEIMLKAESIKWGSNEGQMLENALVLTEDEQVFGIAREILMTNTYQPALNTVYPAVCTFFVYSVGKMFNARMGLLQRPFSVSALTVLRSIEPPHLTIPVPFRSALSCTRSSVVSATASGPCSEMERSISTNGKWMKRWLAWVLRCPTLAFDSTRSSWPRTLPSGACPVITVSTRPRGTSRICSGTVTSL